MTPPIISWSEWEEKYKPTTEVMYDFFNQIEEPIPGSRHVWTVVDNNPNSVYLDIIPGYRMFNRLGFFVTKYPWTDDELTVSNDPSYKE